MWLVEPDTFIGAGEQHIAEQLKNIDVPVILVINKTDTVKQEEILKFIDAYRKIMDFDEIIPATDLDLSDMQAFAKQCLLRLSNPFIDHKMCIRDSKWTGDWYVEGHPIARNLRYLDRVCWHRALDAANTSRNHHAELLLLV